MQAKTNSKIEAAIVAIVANAVAEAVVEEAAQDNVITLPDGSTITFPLDDANHRKFRITDTDGFTEGPWFWMHPDDVHDHDTDVSDPMGKVRYGVSANQCLCGLPWGAVFPYRLSGTQRPDVMLQDVIDWSDGKVIMHPELARRYAEEQEAIACNQAEADANVDTGADPE